MKASYIALAAALLALNCGGGTEPTEPGTTSPQSNACASEGCNEPGAADAGQTPLETDAGETVVVDERVPSETPAAVDGQTSMPGSADVNAHAAGNACVNDTDSPIIATADASVQNEGRTCAFSCFTSGQPNAECIGPCIAENTALTDGCSQCFGGLISCAISKCLSQCLVGATTPECQACRDEKGCSDEFKSCSGIEAH